MEYTDKLSRLKSAVKSGNHELVELAVEDIKNRGDNTYVAPLVEYLHQDLPGEYREMIYRIFNDLKDERAADQVILELKNEKSPEIMERLVASCWQNGMNYSRHLPYFVELVISRDFRIAFEAFTVIENMYGKIDPDTESAVLEEIERHLPGADEKKLYLLKGMLELIPNIPLDQDQVDY